MRRKAPPSPSPKSTSLTPTSASEPSRTLVKDESEAIDKEAKANGVQKKIVARRSGFVWLTLCFLTAWSAWAVYRHQYEDLPKPLSAQQAGIRGFSEVEAMEHVRALTELGPHPVSSDALELGIQYVLEAAEQIKKTAHQEVDVEVDFFQAKPGANHLASGLFKGKTLVYSDLNHVVLRILPKYVSEAGENAVLVSSHFDTVFSAEGAGDCSSCVAVMLELARGVSQWAHGFKNAVIFLFNTGEEEGLTGAHSFITQHPWSPTVRIAVDLEAMGIGGQSTIFQAGPDPWAIENFAAVAKYPSANIIGQDLFSSGAINSATDFQVYKEVAGLSGLDFAYMENTAVYHTRNDKLELLRAGSLQHLGENMLAFLLRVGQSNFPKGKGTEERDKPTSDPAVYFDILGTYMIVYRQSFAKMLYGSVIVQSLLILAASIYMGGYPAAVSLALSCLGIVLTWVFAIAFPVLVAFTLPHISLTPVPYVAFPWLVVGLFAAPSLLGALIGQHLAYVILRKHLSKEYSKRNQLPSDTKDDLVKLEAERWLFKSGFIQWLVLLILGTYYQLGSAYLALVWLVPPAFAYGLLEATLTPVRLPKPLKFATILLSLAVPVLVSSGPFLRMTATVVGMVIRFDRNPGIDPEWLGNAIVAVFIASILCSTLVYLLSSLHLSGAKRWIGAALCLVLIVSLILVSVGTIPAFTQDTARAVNVVHVVDTSTGSSNKQAPASFVSLFSYTPGALNREAEHIKEGFTCGRGGIVDFVTFQVKYSCTSYKDAEVGWSEDDAPTMQVENKSKEDERVRQVTIDTGGSKRWALAINFDEIEDFTLTAESDQLVPLGEKGSINGWHKIQFAGGKNASTKYFLTLYRAKSSRKQTSNASVKSEDQRPLLKLRTDFNHVTPKVGRVLEKLPPWCSLFGKSTSPFTLSFLATLPAEA